MIGSQEVRNGNKTSRVATFDEGPCDWFTGTVRIDPLFQAPDPAFVQAASVTFEPGAEPLGIRIRSAKLLS